MKPAKQTQSSFTYGDYRQWPDDKRWELIAGEAYAMSPAPTRTHQTVLVEILRQVANFLEGKPCQVFVAPFDVRLPEREESDDEIETVVQPDLAVVCDASKLDEKGCRGAPDWVIEVLSPSTASKDHVRKKSLYERHGVREYWLVHPTDQLLTRYLLEGNAFGPALIEETVGSTGVAVLPGLAIEWGFMAAG
ncbi:MAG: Uma2 family endonuclease [Proteobacteria bacterium]|nr:Uma2 family endonuclease [Pseudomonadota bacterium]